jgi:hypothetical protein
MSSLGLQVTLKYALQFPYGRHLDVSRFHGEKGLGLNPLLIQKMNSFKPILKYALQFPYGRHLDVSRFHGEKGLGLTPLLIQKMTSFKPIDCKK